MVASLETGIDLYWLPLGAGGHFVRLNGRIYEQVHSFFDRRASKDLFHTALIVRVPSGRYVIENAWPIPDGNGAARGVVVEGAVGAEVLGRFRTFRYEIRRWFDGSIADLTYAVHSPTILSRDPDTVLRLLDLVSEVPARVWGRVQPGTSEMWNSNSVIAWLLERSGLHPEDIAPPRDGRAPGWGSGIAVAKTSPLPIRSGGER